MTSLEIDVYLLYIVLLFKRNFLDESLKHFTHDFDIKRWIFHCFYASSSENTMAYACLLTKIFNSLFEIQTQAVIFCNFAGFQQMHFYC